MTGLTGTEPPTRILNGDAGRGEDARWEHFEHGADIGVRGIGRSKAQAFEQAALALVAVVSPPSQVVPLSSVGLSCSAADDASLLVAWLNTVVFEMATRQMLFHDFSVRLDTLPPRHHLQAVAHGEPLGAHHQAAAEVKGATYTALEVAPQPGGLWVAQAVVDV